MVKRARKRRGRPINGICLLDKPSGMTSNDALQQCKYLYYAAKAGHTGSLDPMATGVLPLCFGEATKFSSYLLNADKSYLASIELGAVSDTEDADGEITEVRDPSALSDAEIGAELDKLVGAQAQVPPMYSALKKDGQRLYDLARDGIEIEREARDIVVYAISLIEIKRQAPASVSVVCEMTVSKGTYVRSLAATLGERLGVGAYLGSLRRTRVGGFELANCITLDELKEFKQREAFAEMDARLLPIDSGLGHLPSVYLDDDTEFYLSRGNPVQVPKAPVEGEVAIRQEDGGFLGIGFIDSDGRVAPRRLIVT